MNEGTKKKKKWPLVAGVIVALIIVAACVGGGEGAKKIGDSSDGSNSSASVTSTEQSKFAIGDVVELNGVQVTLVGVTESAGAQYLEPAEGNVFLLCEFEINNQSSKDIGVSSIMSFEAYCDDYSISESFTAETVAVNDGKKQLDGTVAAGKKMNGVVGYEVPKDWKKLEVTYSPDYWGSKSITFEASK